MKDQKATYSNPIKQKHLFCLLMLCLMVMTACGNLYTGEEDFFDTQLGEGAPEESIPIMVAFDDPYYNILNRGVGKIDPEDEENFFDKMNPVKENGDPDLEAKPAFYVYAFRKHMGPSYGYNITRATDEDICLVDGSTGNQAEVATNRQDPELSLHGRRAYYNGNGSFANWLYEDKELFYSNKKQSLSFSFDFFAYHFDDSKNGPIERTENHISFPIKIDGSQDLMWGKAELTEEQKATIASIEDQEKREQVELFYYSTYSGRHNIWPIFQMRHQLAYIKFNLIAGNAHGDPVKVHDIKIETHTEGNFVVVSKDPNQELGATFPGNAGIEQLSLRNFNEGKPILKESDNDEDDTWIKRDINLQYNEDGTRPPEVPVGELLIPPGNEVVLHTWLSNLDTREEVEHTFLPINENFVGGKTYNLNITVYGPKQISIDVEATPWKDGGDVDIDIEEN